MSEKRSGVKDIMIGAVFTTVTLPLEAASLRAAQIVAEHGFDNFIASNSSAVLIQFLAGITTVGAVYHLVKGHAEWSRSDCQSNPPTTAEQLRQERP